MPEPAPASSTLTLLFFSSILYKPAIKRAVSILFTLFFRHTFYIFVCKFHYFSQHIPPTYKPFICRYYTITQLCFQCSCANVRSFLSHISLIQALHAPFIISGILKGVNPKIYPSIQTLPLFRFLFLFLFLLFIILIMRLFMLRAVPELLRRFLPACRILCAFPAKVLHGLR